MRRVALLVGLVTLAAFGLARGAWTPRTRSLPTFDAVRASHVASDARLLARDGRLLHEIRVDPSRRVLGWTPLEQISPAFVDAVLRSEDRRFSRHDGVDFLALFSAVWQRLSSGVRRGGSTITMQLVALLDPDLRAHRGRRTWSEKIRQMRAAYDLERSWSKTEIFEAYLNLVPIRGEVEGVTAAAETLLGKAPHGINAAEATIFAVLLRAPSAPPAVVRARARRLAKEGLAPIDAGSLERAANQIFSAPDRRGPGPKLAPHLTRRLFSREPERRTIRSTIDADLQRFVTTSLERELAEVRSHNVRDGAVVVLHNATGAVLAYVGGSGPLATSRHVDGVRARRQAGSTLKPFLYALAVDRRLLTAASLLDDSPLEVPVGTAVYRPRNYDASFHGLVTLRTALASSLNVPAVRTQRLLGEPAFVGRLLALGFTGLVTTGDHYGASLTLGTAEVSLLELANAYRALARGGLPSPVRFTEEPRERRAERRVYSEEASFVIGQILSDREARSTTFGLENALATPFWTAVKTGTSKEMRDNWCVGFSSDYTVGVWVGNYSGEPMHDVSGITGAAPTWLRVMAFLHRDRPSPPPPAPAALVRTRVVFPDGHVRPEWFLEGTEPAGARVEAAVAPPEIASPVHGTTLALDPDIPSDRQRVALVASASTEELTWHVDGKPLGSAARTLLWKPRPGRHALRLVDGAGHTVDEVGFVVRGADGGPRHRR